MAFINGWLARTTATVRVHLDCICFKYLREITLAGSLSYVPDGDSDGRDRSWIWLPDSEHGRLLISTSANDRRSVASQLLPGL